MQFRSSTRHISTLFLLISLVTILFFVHQSAAANDIQPEETALSVTRPTWSTAVPSDPCATDPDRTTCHYSSPIIIDIDGDGEKNVVVATNKGYIVVLRPDGSILWSADTAPHFDMDPGTQEINSSPAVADIDADGQLEIIVGTGTTDRDTCTQGGVIVLDHRGRLEDGWPKFGDDWSIPPENCADSFFGTPAVGDIDNDGDMEVVAGGFDKRIYAWHHDGTLQPGFPPKSHHYDLWGWDSLSDRLSDTIWGSPSLADLDGDGYLDVLVPTDEGYLTHYNDGWTCDHTPPPGFGDDYCGGSLYAIDRNGDFLPGFPRYIPEVIKSSPVVADVTGDGLPEIMIGTGTFYYNQSPSHPTYGFRFYMWNNRGQDMPGWEGGKVTDGPMPAAPALGDIIGDSTPEIVIPSLEGTVYAYRPDGSLVPGFPRPAVNHRGTTAKYDAGAGALLADMDADGKMEIVMNNSWATVIVDGNGDMLTSEVFPGNILPIYNHGSLLLNVPAIADLDGDGHLDLVTMNSEVGFFPLTTTGNSAAWPIYRGNAARTGAVEVVADPSLNISIEELNLFQDVDTTDIPLETNISFTVLHANSTSWNVDSASRVTVTPRTGSTTAPNVNLAVEIDTSGLNKGRHNLGVIDLTVSAEPKSGGPNVTLNQQVQVIVDIAEISTIFLPIIEK